MTSTAAKENLESIRSGKVEYAGPAAAALLSGKAAELLDPGRHGWQRVKRNVSRTVYRGQVDGQAVYVKHFHSPSLVHRLARALGAYDARREMRFCQYLSAHGVQTPPALAILCDGATQWLATRAVEPAEPADLWHEKQLARGPQGRPAVQQAIAELAEMIGRMHAAGVVHRDLHCGNMLVRTDQPAARLVLTDLHRARRRRKLSRRQRAANLAQLFHDRFDFTTRSERLRFLARYLRASQAGGSLRGWQLLVEQFARRHTRRHRAQRDRRVRRNNQYFTLLRLPGFWRARVVLSSKRQLAGSQAAAIHWTREDWRGLLADPAALLQSPPANVVKESPSSRVVRRRLRVGDRCIDVFVKRSRRKQPWKILLDCFRPARCLRAFRLGHALLTRRIATALPLAALERRVGPLLLDSILITEAVDAPNLNRFLGTWLARPPQGDTPMSAAQRRHLAQQVLWQLGRLLQRLHDNHFAHRDLKATNMLIRWSAQTPPEIVLVDLDGLMAWPWLTTRRKFQGLMRLNVSLLKCPAVNRAGRLRMLTGYLRRPGAGPVDYKRYWRMLEDWSDKKLRQQIHSRRKRQKAARRPA